MRVTYILRQEGDPVETHCFGHRFIAGMETQVHDPEALKSLAGNPWFLIEGLTVKQTELIRDNQDPTPVQVYEKRGRGRPPKVRFDANA